MKLTQGQFSFLPDLTDEEISAQVQYALDNEWSLAVEHTDDPHPRNIYWAMWGEPMFDLKDAAGVMMEVRGLPRGEPEPLRQGARLRREEGVRDGSHVVPSSSVPRTSRASS